MTKGSTNYSDFVPLKQPLLFGHVTIALLVGLAVAKARVSTATLRFGELFYYLHKPSTLVIDARSQGTRFPPNNAGRWRQQQSDGPLIRISFNRPYIDDFRRPPPSYLESATSWRSCWRVGIHVSFDRTFDTPPSSIRCN